MSKTPFYDLNCRISYHMGEFFTKEYVVNYAHEEKPCTICGDLAGFVEEDEDLMLCSIECLSSFDSMAKEILNSHTKANVKK